MKEFDTHFCKGKYNKVALILSCPGKEEEKNGRPVSGITGKNLREVLKKLQSNNKIFSVYDDLYDYRITNSVSTIEYNAKTGRSEAKPKEIKSSDNIIRLQNETNDIEEIIICFGNAAKTAINHVDFTTYKPNVKFVFTRHLSPLSLNRIKGMKSPEERINYIVEDILKQIS